MLCRNACRFDLAEAWRQAPERGRIATAVLQLHLRHAGRNSNNILQARPHLVRFFNLC